MRVLITGATGYVGSWTARAVQARGHDTRLLVRDAARARAMGDAVGFDATDLVVGDMRDADVVADGLRGCDAVVHAAALVEVRTGVDSGMSANLDATRVVVGQAVEQGADPVVHVSSTAALWGPARQVLTAEQPVGEAADAYGASKIEVEHYVRGLQQAGHPVVVSYPGAVVGPPAGTHLGEAGDGMVAIVEFGSIPGRRTAFNLVDVRDLAEAHARMLEPGRGARRYVVGGRRVGAAELARELQARTGSRVLHVPVPGGAMVALGRLADRYRRFAPAVLDSVSAGSMTYLTRMPPADSSPVQRELGVGFRPLAETLEPLCEEIVRRRRGDGQVTPRR